LVFAEGGVESYWHVIDSRNESDDMQYTFVVTMPLTLRKCNALIYHRHDNSLQLTVYS